MLETIEERFRAVVPAVDFCSLRFVRERTQQLSVVRGAVRPVRSGETLGAMITVHDGGGLGYAATSDLTPSGLSAASEEARRWARRTAGRMVADLDALPRTSAVADEEGPAERPWDSVPLSDKLQLLREAAQQLRGGDAIVTWVASLSHRYSESLYLTSDGARIRHGETVVIPTLSTTANRGSESQTRHHSVLRRGGLEVLEGELEVAARLAEEAIELLDADDCPQGLMDVVLAPSQMVIQIHESIGHPLELDRVLGDERNYAGTTFVTPEMFGSYRYGSELLNVSFDPTRPEQLASYAYDDEGQAAAKQLLIEGGILKRGLGGALSQQRTGIEGVANARACSWNRPPIDRMANLNVEPGDSSLQDLIGSVERGVYLESNNSWSIDDSRNKFQFGCERGRLIRDGELGPVVKNANYRGVSGTFWRSLAGVGNASTFVVSGATNCGKGEPNQAIPVGHASPTCMFHDVEVFGGA